MGIDVNRVIASTFFIGSALAGAAGIFNCLVYQQVWPYMGFDAGLKAFTAAVVGGIGSLPGAVVGGLLIGLTESFATGYLSSTFQDAIVFVILIADDDPAPDRPVREGRGEQGLMADELTPGPDPSAPQEPRTEPRAVDAAHRRRRVGRLARGPPRGPRRSRRPDPASGSSGRPTPIWLRGLRHRRGDAAAVDEQRLRDPCRLRHAALHAARARPEHHGRLRRDARPRLHRVLRLRRLRLRDARLRQVRPALADARDLPGRADPDRCCSGCSSRSRRGGSSATTSRS